MYLRYRIYRFFNRVWARVRRRPYLWGGSSFVALVLIYLVFISAPFDFPTGAYINIPAGSSLGQSAQILSDRHIIRSPFLFKVMTYVFGAERHVTAGEYFFPARENLFGVAVRMGEGDFEVDPAKVRIPEGATLDDISKLLSQNVPDFNLAEFTDLSRGKEGYLFPDTYFVMPGEGTEAILGAFQNNFDKNIAKIQPQIDAFGKPLSDVIIMASILEREAPDIDDRRIIAGILWKRISLGMPLQVDAVFPYIIGKNSLQLTNADLQYNSPYNTYIHTGLPPGPISNPGLDSILAAVTTTPTNYLYYLSDRQGNLHYSVTYAQHLAAKDKYLGN